MTRSAYLCWGFLLGFLTVSTAWGNELDQKPASSGDDVRFAELCKTAEGQFSPIQSSQVQTVLCRVRQKTDALECRLVNWGSKPEKIWRDYLDWDQWAGEVKKTSPDLTKLDAIYSRLGRDDGALGLIWFVELRQALGDYLNVARGVDNPEIQTAYKKLLVVLPGLVTDYQETPTDEKAAQIGQAIAWLERFHQADEVVADVRCRFGRPNFYGQVSRDFAAMGLEESLEEEVTVRDRILRTPITGSGVMTGTTKLQFVPCEDRAIFQWLVDTTACTNNVGRRMGVSVYSNATTLIESQARLMLDADGLYGEDAVSSASTHTRFTKISACSPLIRSFAWRQACSTKGRAEAEAARHAKRRANRRIDSRIQGEVEKFNQQYLDRVQEPLAQRMAFPDQLQFSTTETALEVVGREMGVAELAAPNGPPVLEKNHHIALRLHESAINNLTSTLLAGRTLDEPRLYELTEEMLGRVPEFLKQEEGQPTWEVEFADRGPLTVEFDGGFLAIVLRAKSFTRDGSRYDGMNVTARYKIEKIDAGYQMVRQDKIAAFPPGFDQEKRRLSGREQTLRRLLEKRFAKVFPESWELNEPIRPEKRWAKAGEIFLNECDTQAGWIVLGWDAKKESKP